MSARSRAIADRVYRRVTRPPEKVVLYSLVAFLIMAACPYIITQFEDTEDSVAESHFISADQVSRVLYFDGSDWVIDDHPTTIIEDDSEINLYLASADDYSTIMAELVYNEDYPLPDNVRKVVITVENATVVTVSLNGDKSFEHEADTNVWTYDCNLLMSSYISEMSSNYIVFRPIDTSQPVVFTLDYQTFGDDYTGSTVCLVCGVSLLILAVFSTPYINLHRRS